MNGINRTFELGSNGNGDSHNTRDDGRILCSQRIEALMNEISGKHPDYINRRIGMLHQEYSEVLHILTKEYAIQLYKRCKVMANL